MIIPVMDIWCSGTSSVRSPCSTMSVVSGTAVPTITAERQPIVNSSTRMTSPTPVPKFVASALRRSSV